MTPEQVAYYRLMLLAGQSAEYEQALDLALETMDPITPPVLDLAMCMSDPNQTISVLYNYLQDHPADDRQVADIVIEALRRQYLEGLLTAAQVCETLRTMQLRCSFEPPTLEFYTYLYEYELWEEGLISRELFETAFSSVFLHGKQLDVWQKRK